MDLWLSTRERVVEKNIQLQTGSYKPNDSFEIENWLALLLNPETIQFYQATHFLNATGTQLQ